MLDFPIDPSQTDAKSPMDEQLADDIRLNLEALKAGLNLTGGSGQSWKVNGFIGHLSGGKARLDGGEIAKATTFQLAQLMLEEPGDGGTLEVDIRRYSTAEAPIKSFTRVFSARVNSISRLIAGLSTQSIAPAAAQITTQSVAQWKTSLNITSIMRLESSSVLRVNLLTMPDADWVAGDSVKLAGTTNGQNDHTGTILRVAEDGGANVVIRLDSGIGQSQTVAGGTATLGAWAYTFVNPVSMHFAPGEFASFSGHTAPQNDGVLKIYAINRSGNNIVVKNALGVAQNTIGGSVNTFRWIYSFNAPVPEGFTTIDETVETRFHTNPVNDHYSVPVKGINVSGNNLILYRPEGVVQGGAGGTVDTNRYLYGLNADPAGKINVGDRFYAFNTQTPGMDAESTALIINANGVNNVVAFNDAGATSPSTPGRLYSKKLIASFYADKSAVITTDSKIVVRGTGGGAFDGDYQVVGVNLGGGANYNAVIETTASIEQLQAGGRVVAESKSLFDVRPSVTVPSADSGAANAFFRVSTNAVFNEERKTVPANTLLMLDLVRGPTGYAKNFTVKLV